MRVRITLATLAASAVAVPFGGTSDAADAGCVTTWAFSGHYGPAVEQVVTVDQYGRVVVDPRPATSYANYVARDAASLVHCIV